MKKIKMYVIVIIFFISIIIPGISLVFNIDLNTKLNGTTISSEMPQISFEGIMNGSNQEEINLYIQEIIPIRNIIIKMGNQIVYSLFKVSTNSNIAIGDDGQLFEKGYINKELQYSEVVSDEILKEEIAHLEELKEKLKTKGINMLVLLTPYKTEFYREEIPWAYKICVNNIHDDANDYERFTNLLSTSNIDYFDAVDYVYELQEQYTEEVFPKTGTHWSQLTGMRVTKQLISELETKFGYDLADVEVDYKINEEPMWPDTDIFQLLNIYSKPYDKYYVPEINVINEGNDKPNILARGGSFMGQSVNHLIDKEIVNESVYIENTFARVNNSETYSVDNYETLNFKDLVKGKDLIIFETNQATVGNVGLGLMEYMYQHFEEIFE